MQISLKKGHNYFKKLMIYVLNIIYLKTFLFVCFEICQLFTKENIKINGPGQIKVNSVTSKINSINHQFNLS